MTDLGTENAFKVLAVVNKLKSQGRDIISFGLGEPDFNTPSNIKEAAIAALKQNYTHYGPSAGLPALREAIAKYVSRSRKIDVVPEEVIVTLGGKPIIFYSILCLINPGDEVIYPNPGYPIYESIINFVGAKAVPVPIIEEKGFSLDVNNLKSLITPKTKMIVLNSPQNPTGGIIEKNDLEAIADLAKKHDLIILADEIYSEIVFEGQFNSISTIPGMKERTIILDGLSKTYSMTGWRVGYGIFNKEIAMHIANLETNSVSCTATFSQIASIEALNGPQDETRIMVDIFKKRCKIIVDGLNDIKGIKCLQPKGAFYVFPNVTQVCRKMGFVNSDKFQQFLLHEAGVAVLPRSSFGLRNTAEKEEYVRLCYAVSEKEIVEGLLRIKKAVEKN